MPQSVSSPSDFSLLYWSIVALVLVLKTKTVKMCLETVSIDQDMSQDFLSLALTPLVGRQEGHPACKSSATTITPLHAANSYCCGAHTGNPSTPICIS